MSVLANENMESGSLKSNWGLIDGSRIQMAKEITTLSNSLSGPRAKQLKSVSRFLKSSPSYEAVLERPDVLCFCQPWLDAISNKTNQEQLTESEIASAIGAGFCRFENNAPLPRDMTPFLYPAIAFLAWLVMITCGAIFLLPSFRTMFEEFGIELPLSTQYIISIGMWLEENWPFLFACVLLMPLTLLFLLWLSQRGSAYSLNWLDLRISHFRTKLGIWASHLASLLSAGVNEAEAIQIAGRCSASDSLRVRCDDYAEDRNQDFLDPTMYPLISNSLFLKDQSAKIKILEETARYYQSLSRIVQSWWLTWLSKAISVLIFATLIITVASLFAPLISIISGLTGGY